MGALGTRSNGAERDATLGPVVTLLTRITVLVLLAAHSDTPDKRVTLQAWWTAAESPVELCLAHSSIAAGSSLAGINAFLRDAGLVKWAVIVLLAFV